MTHLPHLRALVALLMSVVLPTLVEAQSPVAAHTVEIHAAGVRLDQRLIAPSTTVAQLAAILGEPSRRESADGFALTIWDSLGVVARARGVTLHEVSFHLRLPEPIPLPGGMVFRDSAEPTSPFTGTARAFGADVPPDMATFRPDGAACESPAANHRCRLTNGTSVFLSPNRGSAELLVVQLRR